MKILAIDTSSIVVSVSIVDKDKLLGEITINYKQNHSETLMPIVDTLLKMLDLDISEIDYFAITKGPGSFTGLRIGASTIKAMAHALNKKIVAISTLEVMAYNVVNTNKVIVPIIDAKGGRVFTGVYFGEYDNLKVILEDSVMNIDALLEYLKNNDFEPLFLGDGAITYKNEIIENFGKSSLVNIAFNMQRASSLAVLSKKYIVEGKVLDYNSLEIEYMRKSQAEREKEERNKNDKN